MYHEICKTSILLICIILISGCIAYDAEKAPKVLFDTAHGEVFSPNDMKSASFTEFYKMFHEKGFDVGINEEPITSGTLSDVGVLVIAGHMKELNNEEISGIKNFVHGGGALLVLVHVSRPVKSLLQEFQTTISGFVTSEAENLIGSSSQDFFVQDLEDHPITKGVEKIAVFGSWSIISNEPVRNVAWTSKAAWSEVNKNMKFDIDYEKQERLGVVSAAEFGKGKVVIIADDAVFLDKFINTADNRLLGENIITWFK